MAAFFFGKCLVLCLLISSVITQDATVNYRLMEENPAKQYIGSVAIDSQLFNDVSNEEFQSLQFQIIRAQNNYMAYFQIESNTSLLWTSKTIDREEFPDCVQDCLMEFNVAVYDLNLTELTKIINIKINIEDDNDNAPVFLPINNPIKIPESVEMNSVIVSGAAIDEDKSEINSVKTYKLLPEMNPPVFSLVVTENKEFELINNVMLDRETLSEYQFVIQAIDGGAVPNTGTTTLQIEVTDANDNAPSFTEESYNISVEENIVMNTVILTLSATDPDSDSNGKIMFSFSNRVSDKILKHFFVNSHSGELSVVGTIDYETEQKFSFQVVAYDLGEQSKSSTANVHINVEDANDNSPVINLNQPPGGTKLLESSDIGAFVAHVEIVDVDSDDNGIVSCHIPDQTFRLEQIGLGSNYKIVLNKSLDYDIQPRHNVTILCEDHGDLPRQTAASFIVHVEDVNDNAPLFTEDIYAVSVTENNQLGAFIVVVSAEDEDSESNGQISYALHPDSIGLFILNPDSGVITANVSLDREVHGNKYLFHVLAIDNGDPVHSSTGTVVVNINDVNDNDPIFDEDPMEFYVFENLVVDSKVGNISVSDPDNDINGSFKLIFPDGEISEFFKFEQSGIIKTSKVLDRESIAVHKCIVYAVDMGGRTSSAEVHIFVKDVNDNRPEVIYPNEYDNTIQVPVAHPSNSFVVQIEARDYDSGDNAKLSYKMRENNSSGVFTIDPLSGKMYLIKSVTDSVGDIFIYDIDISDGGVPSLNTSVTLGLLIVPELDTAVYRSGLTVNLWIVLGIVLLTVVLSSIMIFIILKTCWYDQRKKNPKATISDILGEPNQVDLKFDNCPSPRTKSATDPEDVDKVKDMYLELKLNDPQKDYCSSLNETGYFTNSSGTSVGDPPSTEQVGTLTFNCYQQTSTDEIGSNNSGEMYTHDSGRGGSELDLNITVDSPGYHSIENHYTFQTIPRQDVVTDNYDCVQVFNPSDEFIQSECNKTNNTSNGAELSDSMAIYSTYHRRTAEKREISKLCKIPKHVMFSDDLESVHSNDLSKSLTVLTSPDQINDYYNKSKFNRILIDDAVV